jgi:diguanylate cyclase (GGDEF)-like protein/PAS domain S-box-containing protein
MQNALDGIHILDLQGNVLEANEAFCNMLGYTQEEMAGLNVADWNSQYSREALLARLQSLVGKSARFETVHRRKDGTLIDVEISTTGTEIEGEVYFLASSRDITERKAAERQIRFLTDIYTAQSQINQALTESKDEATLFDRVCQIVVDFGGMELAWIGIHDEQSGLIKPAAMYGQGQGYLDNIVISPSADIPEGRGPSGTAYREQRSVYIQNFQTDPLVTPWYDRVVKYGWHSSGTVPILRAGKPYAILTFYHTQERVFSAEIIHLLDEAAMNIGRGLDHFDLEMENLKAQESLQLAAMVYENSSEAIIVTDAQNCIIAANPAFTAMTGYTLDEVKGKNPRIFKSGRHGREFYQSMWHALHKDGHWHGEVWDTRKDGQLHVKLLTINVIKDDQGKIFRHIALFTDITSRKNVEELVWRQANFDTLTGLPNRQMFRDRLQQEAKKAERSGKLLALMLVDLDRFKEVNDTLGHDQGDILLVEAAQRITGCIRKSDTVARLGGDEFIVILPELEDAASIERVAQAIIASINEPFALTDNEAYVSASIGIAIYQEGSRNLDDLFKNVDQAMYVAKSAGRNRFAYFTADMQEAAVHRMRLVNDLRAALAAGQFSIHYQPIVELASGRIHKAEALLRWHHPQRGPVNPVQFIPLAEETGLIVPIGDWVFEEAVKQVAQWRSRFDPDFQISVNKSPVQIRYDGNNHIAWSDCLRERNLPGQSIAVEITEGLLLHAEADVKGKLLGFRDAGIQVAIDDFGTGYSSLAYLKKFDIDYLKIDRSFVCNLGTNKDDLALCEAMIIMAHKLGLQVVAEGVETAQQRDLLRAAGCDYAQGYLYSRPVPPAEFEKLLGR